MGKVVTYEKDGYIFEDPLGVDIPWPIARIDEHGSKIPLSMDEIGDWQAQYLIDHPDIAEKRRKIEEELRIKGEEAAANVARIRRKIEWWDYHPLLKAICKPFLPSYYETIKR